MESPYRHELEVAIKAVQQAAQISRLALSLAHEQSSGGDADIFDITKDDLSPVTIADFAIQALLTRTISQAFPQDGFVGEESADQLRQNPRLSSRVLAILEQAGAALFRDADELCQVIDSCTTYHPSGADSPSGRVWVFDPIDGTRTFIRREQYAINIALLEHGRQILSLVACPVLSMDASSPVNDRSIDPTGTGCILFAAKGYGAYVRPLPGNLGEVKPRRLGRHADKVHVPADLRPVTCTTLPDSGILDIHKAVAERLNVTYPGCDLLGWVPRWAVLSLGLANFTVWVYKRRDRYAKLWDHAGAMLLFEEVGGVITDVYGKEIDLGSGRKLASNFGFVAAPKDLHHVVLQAVQETLISSRRTDLFSQ
ncbi:carbohydrate phosphatase [Canariomyces notabilis]|uniref:Carbohydrate phosphatase n=1 Tax=Canariomyces notabilis TaxID=2074819 RepID=A0AAN6QFY2_9PEZI|nr:carbohydrate phosphatase [Canariomyces arenarius]